jgi:hypothetical protein
MSSRFLTRIFRRYVKITPGSLYESNVQVLIERNLSALFPEYFGKLMDPYFRTAGGDVQPDLVLVRRDYKGWMLVEVEVEGHSAQGHILPQLSKLVRVTANEEVSKRLIDSFGNDHSLENLELAILYRPEVTLVMHGSSEHFQGKLNELGVYSLDVEIHSYPPDEYVLEVLDRDENYLDTGHICRRSSNLATQFVWSLPKFEHLNLTTMDSKVEVCVDSEMSLWEIKVNRTDYLLRQPTGLQSLNGVNEVYVYRHRNFGSLKFIPLVERTQK